MIESVQAALVWSTLGISAVTTVQFLVNLLFFRRAPHGTGRPNSDAATALVAASAIAAPVSVLIPARNEALRIEGLLDSILANTDVGFEVCVLDDESTDGTADVVRRYADGDPRIRLIRGQPVPPGWSGKQYACWQLVREARHPELVFLDADVTLAPDALRRAVGLRRAANIDLLSGFPRQQVVTIGEQLLIPLIPQILLCFLPFPLMRWTRMVAAAAGCGQFFVTSRAAYELAGGHAMIRQSLHDGIRLPRSYRSHGLRTDLFDASDIASCRMYSSFTETWHGLEKNATEGFARLPLLPVITTMMLLAFVAPVLELLALAGGILPGNLAGPIAASCVFAWLPRFWCCVRFDRAWKSVLFAPVSIGLFLAIQWLAWATKLRGRRVAWRQRTYEAVAP